MTETNWKCNFKLVINSKDGVSLEDFNASLDKFIINMIDGLPNTGTADPESAISGWSGGLNLPIPNDDPEYTF